MTEDALKCYRVLDGGEVHYIVARDEDEARDMFVEECNSDDGALLDAQFKKITREDMAKVKVRMTLADLFDDADKPCVLAGTVD